MSLVTSSVNYIIDTFFISYRDVDLFKNLLADV